MSGASSCWRLFAALVVAVSVVPSISQPSYPVEGYINVVHSPTDFEVGGRRFYLNSNTAFGLIGDDSTTTKSPLREQLRVGVYVEVAAPDPGPFKPFIATTVLVRDDWGRKVSGVGVITRVVLPPSPTAVFEADGYLIRISPSTNVNFLGDLNALADVSENTWLHFKGKRDRNGVIEASKADFFAAKPTKFKAVKGLEIVPVKTRPAGATDNTTTSEAKGTVSLADDGASLQQDEQIKIGLGRWHTIPADQPLQQRVHKIGMALVPAYQRDLADDDPSKIHFRFFAVDDKVRGSECLLDGAILISTEAMNRLQNDDQVAAVLADGIACNLQRQAARMISMNRAVLAAVVAGDVAGAFVPGLSSAVRGAAGGVDADEEEVMLEERLRISLALMKDAGFNPWQAPQAWRLLDPKKLSGNPAQLPYPDASCYQIETLNLQYAAN